MGTLVQGTYTSMYWCAKRAVYRHTREWFNIFRAKNIQNSKFTMPQSRRFINENKMETHQLRASIKCLEIYLRNHLHHICDDGTNFINIIRSRVSRVTSPPPLYLPWIIAAADVISPIPHGPIWFYRRMTSAFFAASCSIQHVENIWILIDLSN